ncbi:hypothetical protein HDV02_002776 [Globomyces sp. JEL0801]|nr:hypothetical protein HDV02_002776 [Globomyces sp. JEL0801]
MKFSAVSSVLVGSVMCQISLPSGLTVPVGLPTELPTGITIPGSLTTFLPVVTDFAKTIVGQLTTTSTGTKPSQAASSPTSSAWSYSTLPSLVGVLLFSLL